MEVNGYGYTEHEPHAEADVLSDGHGYLHRGALSYSELFIRSVSDKDSHITLRSGIYLSVPGFATWFRESDIEYAFRRFWDSRYGGRLYRWYRDYCPYRADTEERMALRTCSRTCRAGAGAGSGHVSVIFSQHALLADGAELMYRSDPSGDSRSGDNKSAGKSLAAGRDGGRSQRKGREPMSGRNKKELEGVSLLGNKDVSYPSDYAPQVLETFKNKHPENDYFVKFNCPEFTSLCPMTGQPDFATIYISYVPGESMVESKSLKLYLFSFRNHGDFHEDCVNIIMKDLIKLMDPKYIEVWGKFTPRGGISIDPYCNYGKPGTVWEKVAFERLSHHDLYPEKVDNR